MGEQRDCIDCIGGAQSDAKVFSEAALGLAADPEALRPWRSSFLGEFQVDMGVRFGLAGPQAVECLRSLQDRCGNVEADVISPREN